MPKPQPRQAMTETGRTSHPCLRQLENDSLVQHLALAQGMLVVAWGYGAHLAEHVESAFQQYVKQLVAVLVVVVVVAAAAVTDVGTVSKDLLSR